MKIFASASRNSSAVLCNLFRSNRQKLPLRMLLPLQVALLTLAGAATLVADEPEATVGSRLAVVVGLFAALVWVSKKSGVAARGSGTLPDTALRLLGQKSLGTAGSIALVRCGRRVLVVGLSSAGMQPLGEITDAEEVRSLETLCLGEGPASFREVLGDVHVDMAASGLGGEEFNRTTLRRKLFAEG